ncbi:MAG: hypothetical protein CMI08_10075 [Oceanospirillaceae bacterium]|uniref:hypothetical protein n=1 Tax=unclassified Thalassolituus TaxID=2624967 RepID=UPI000C57C9FE|nr:MULTISPECIES: hypothetical protein [unclassified Thalassolituus]MAS23942.1 hypothetical protein [Oceanospirillaceae bacterium]MAX99532.1 hypothetical protein [Oceanospirillaceae bacterium]MBL35090.1 hypothetical protein [Oceanospirillaceae bacterium]MBS54900.1 hypothetical protein [Oceanospirillaceae bacterium]|tara:strand:- start:496 stop:1203 length:708 start_codon:yes stop_codon:yes gene_type:complete
MSRTIFFFVKVFDKKEYAEDFIKGKLFSNRLSFFRKYEEDESANRGDKHEGVVGWHQSDQIRLKINGRVITDLAGPVMTQMNWHDHLNVFCIYAAHSGEFEEISEETIDDFKKQISIPEECKNLGEYAVIVTNVTKFIERVKAAVRSNNYELNAGLVEYYDPTRFNGSFSEVESIFRKREEYKHQKEYRFSFDTGIAGTDPLILNIGDISDITMQCKVCEINAQLEVKLPSDENA